MKDKKKYAQRQLEKIFADYLTRKIYIEVGVMDSWDSWVYKIWGEDSMSPFYLMQTSGFDSWGNYWDALNDAVNWLKHEGL